MKLEQLLPLDKWEALENEIHQRFGMDANIFNTEGRRITSVKNWVNPLCRAIKDTDKGQAFICAVAHMNLAAIAKNTKKPVVEECDAGIAKIVVPVFDGDEFIGAFGACGKLLEDGEVDDFMVNKTTEIDEGRITKLSEGVGSISEKKAWELAVYIGQRISALRQS